ncbi:hypothetical protein C0584_04720 [Candidatus Parcubacteria bacterium]|nr:MAG: hypothetical protein C0584_04720 [Candidatus Parcubacteria bacterium]
MLEVLREKLIGQKLDIQCKDKRIGNKTAKCSEVQPCQGRYRIVFDNQESQILSDIIITGSIVSGRASTLVIPRVTIRVI